MLRGDRPTARVEKGEGARAIGVLGAARRQAGLSERGRHLVAGDPADGQAGPEDAGVRLRQQGGGRSHLRQHGHGHADDLAEPGVPASLGDVEEQRAAGVGDIREVRPTAREAPDEEAVHGAEAELAGLGARPQARLAIEDVGDLGAAEVGVQGKPRARPDAWLVPGLAQGGTALGGDAALPDDGRRHGAAGGALPDDGRLALVGDAQRGDAGDPPGHLVDGLAGHGQLALPDVLGVVGHVAGEGVALRVLLLGERHRTAVPVEDDRPGGGRALVEGQDERPAHAGLPGAAVPSAPAATGSAGGTSYSRRAVAR